MKTWQDRIQYATVDCRQAKRHGLTLSGELLTAEGTYACLVENISTGGVRVRTGVHLTPGDPGILKCDDLDILAEVQWRSGNTMGLAFVEATAPGNHEDESFADANRRANNRRFFRLLDGVG